ARGAPEQLGEGRLHLHAPRQAMAVAAVGVVDVVAFGEREVGPGGHRLLALAEMGRAMDQPLEIAALDLLLELADAHHGLVEPQALAPVERRQGVVVALAGRRYGRPG